MGNTAGQRCWHRPLHQFKRGPCPLRRLWTFVIWQRCDGIVGIGQRYAKALELLRNLVLVIIECREDASNHVKFLYFQSNEVCVIYQTQKISTVLSQLPALLICVRREQLQATVVAVDLKRPCYCRLDSVLFTVAHARSYVELNLVVNEVAPATPDSGLRYRRTHCSSCGRLRRTGYRLMSKAVILSLRQLSANLEIWVGRPLPGCLGRSNVRRHAPRPTHVGRLPSLMAVGFRPQMGMRCDPLPSDSELVAHSILTPGYASTNAFPAARNILSPGTDAPKSNQ